MNILDYDDFRYKRLLYTSFTRGDSIREDMSVSHIDVIDAFKIVVLR